MHKHVMKVVMALKTEGVIFPSVKTPAMCKSADKKH